MQELLGRISRLDPSASLGLRVIACFDELVVGNVNSRALLASAASLAGCVAGFRQQEPAREIRISPDGRRAGGAVPERREEFVSSVSEGLSVWLEREGPAGANDAIILERLALAVRIRHGQGRRDYDNRRHLDRLLDEAQTPGQRSLAASALGLSAESRYRVVAAPLFAGWGVHPAGPEDVIPTLYGPIHVIIVSEPAGDIHATPCGIGVSAQLADLHRSFRTALVALRLYSAASPGPVNADNFGALINFLADSNDSTPQPDVERLHLVLHNSWGPATVAAIVESTSVRQAARMAGVHHSTMQTRLDTIMETLGFDPFDGFGRTRLGAAHLVWRLHTSNVLALPPPATPAAPELPSKKPTPSSS